MIFALVFSLLAALGTVIARVWAQPTLAWDQLSDYSIIGLAIIGCILLVLTGYLWDGALHRRLQALSEQARVREQEGGAIAAVEPEETDEVMSIARRLEHMAQSLQNAQASYRAIVEDLTDLVCRYRPDGRLTFVNGAYARFCGQNRTALLGQVFPPYEQDLLPRSVKPSPREATTFEQQLEDAAGNRRWIAWTNRMIPDPEGGVLEFQAVGHDVTTRKEAETTLREAKEAAEAADRVKTEFLAIIRHEIETPINGIVGFCRLLQETPLSGDQKDCVDMIRSCGNALEALVSDMLDLSQIEAGRLNLRLAPFALHRCVEEVLALFGGQAREAGLGLDFGFAPDVPAIVIGDQHRLVQILTNLVGNGVKFTKQGKVTVDVSCVKGELVANTNRRRIALHFAVRDTGIGIPEEKQPLLFRPFSQVDTSARRAHGGTGLGLAIAKRLCEMMGGTIGVESHPGTGSTFSFSAQMEYERRDSTSPFQFTTNPDPVPAS